MSNVLRFKLLLLTTILFISASSYARKPKWVKERPSLNDYYQGIGVADKIGATTDYTLAARSKALKEMSSEIQVSVSANSLLHQFENNTDIRESFESNTSVKTAQTLEGYEIETYQDNKSYWVYVRLSKARCEQEKRLQLDKAKKLASINYYKGVELLKENDASGALTNFLKVISSLKDHLEEDLTIKSLDGDINLGSNTYTNIQFILQRISLTPKQATIAVKFSREMEQPLQLNAVYHSSSSGEVAAFNLPISFTFSKGDGVISSATTTNYDGQTTCLLTRLKSHIKRQQIKAQLNINALLDPDIAIARIQKAFLPIETLPETTFNIEMQRTKAFVIINETQFGKSTNGNLLANSIKSELNQNFFTYTDNPEEADFTVNIKVNFTNGETKAGSNYTVFIVYGEITISITSNKRREEVFSDGISGIKGIRPGNTDQATKDAVTKSLEAFEKGIIPKLEQLEM